MPADDYYTLLGVDADAPVDEIRAAYRDRKSTIDTASEQGRADAAQLNKAWNVLSDPYQRGRYDAQRAERGLDDGDTDASETPPAPNGKAPARAQRPARGQRQPLVPTIQLPKGLRFPAPRQRLMAMGVDLAVLLVLFFGSQFATQAMAFSQHHVTVNCITALRDAVGKESTKNQTQKSTDPLVAKARTDCQKDGVTVTGAYKDDNSALTKEENKLSPLGNTILGVFFLVGFAYLVVPTIVSGRTFGKRTQRLRVAAQDGSRARTGDIVKRYGILVLATYALWFLLGPLAAIVVIVGVTTWMRNGNMQGLHDRFARTIVVTDS